MRAKSLLDPIAADVGLTIVDYAEQPVRALPLPTPPPRQLFARHPIRVVCKGSYAEIASFLLRVEKLLPHVALQALQIKAQKDPEAQAEEIVVIDGLKMDEIKTRTFKTFLTKLGVEGKALVVTESVDENVIKSARNIAGVETTFATVLSPYMILTNGKMVVDKAALAKIEEVFA